ncbi:MAG: SdiA-regulated domain-containing protein [Crocinitomicaceae bacterium]|nr:SdiA-regulated domain-containing protein [Crocinitomicaceae bacterium]
MKIFRYNTLALTSVVIGFITFSAGEEVKQFSTNYDFNNPDLKIELPDELYEISGLTDVSYDQIACVQDEKGSIFIFDFLAGRIEQEIVFSDAGDYEGLTRVGNTLYVLASNGHLYETNLKRKRKTKSYQLNLPAADNEGLCYDEKNNRLLIAPKSKIGKGSEFKDLRAVYIFNLDTKQMEMEPLFYFRISEINQIALTKNNSMNGIKNFRPSSIAVHPVTQEIYILSAEDFAISVFNQKGSLKDVYLLDKKLYPKPEGITFLKDNSMVITNEGIEGNASLLVMKTQQ